MSYAKGSKMRLQWVRSQKALMFVTGVGGKKCSDYCNSEKCRITSLL